jgi:hypothetical protein
MKRNLSLLDHLGSFDAAALQNEEALPVDPMLSEIQKRVMKLGLVGKGAADSCLCCSPNSYATPREVALHALRCSLRASNELLWSSCNSPSSVLHGLSSSFGKRQ